MAGSEPEASQEGPTSNPSSVQLDFDRQERCGFAEVIYGPGKPIDVLIGIVEQLRAANQPVLATRLDSEQIASLQKRFEQGIVNEAARTFRWDLERPYWE